ncbi:hypothetical protein [Thermomonospora curvata]|uniref:Uncharacterized protein n=1 Tax=Thermomonospora curvata (strain ATCC 19995 / DSM 43183 / JCM 3096 / KCTC 9072 / NBRC 15933 / NCIMB 10081 / Henssen B9) TaxID=471852 RepID=D1A563_THECD|nr:hypothetical protein [Thermomonospora curvata]ACZ00049.1 hypothetical protein Tcur_4521 [Thermomonospora curvata DSM 43183]
MGIAIVIILSAVGLFLGYLIYLVHFAIVSRKDVLTPTVDGIWFGQARRAAGVFVMKRKWTTLPGGVAEKPRSE